MVIKDIKDAFIFRNMIFSSVLCNNSANIDCYEQYRIANEGNLAAKQRTSRMFWDWWNV